MCARKNLFGDNKSETSVKGDICFFGTLQECSALLVTNIQYGLHQSLACALALIFRDYSYELQIIISFLGVIFLHLLHCQCQT